MEQAKKLARKFKRQDFDMAYCSDLQRAVSTANEIIREKDLHLTKRTELKEVNFGLLKDTPPTK